jgi:hypothetical protein
MFDKRSIRVIVALICVTFGALAPRASEAITMHQPGWVATSFATVPLTSYAPSDIELDGSGNLYVPTGPNAIQRITPAGVVSVWSSAPGVELTRSPAGDFYGAGGGFCDCVAHIQSDGSFSTLHQDALEWRYVELSPDGTLYCIIWAGAGQGLYTIDRTSGQPTLVHAGGPAANGDGTNFDMAFGLDGKLYMIGDDTVSSGLFRLDGSTFTRVATLPRGAFGLTRDPAGIFYANVSADGAGEVWMIDATAGTASLLASQLSHPQAVGYDPMTSRLYVVEDGGKIWALSPAPTPTRRTSFGALKSLYR